MLNAVTDCDYSTYVCFLGLTNRPIHVSFSVCPTDDMLDVLVENRGKMTKLTVSYARVSSASQKTDRQVQSFRRADATLGGSTMFARHYEDKVSGVVKFRDRVAGRQLLNDCEKGEIGEIHFHEISRAGRDIADITITIQYFVENKIQVIIQKEGIRLLNDDGTVNATAQIVLSVMTCLSSIERTNIRERQMEGIAIAKAKGLYTGRRLGSHESLLAFLEKPKSQKIIKLLRENTRVTHIAKILSVSVRTVYKVRDRLVA